MRYRVAAATFLLAIASAGQAQTATDMTLPAPTIFAPGDISGPSSDGAPTFSPDGKTLYFERTNNNWTIILSAHMTGGHWSKATIAPFAGPWSDQQPTLSPDGSYLVYVSPRPAPSAPGAAVKRVAHLYRVDRRGPGWSNPVELPPEVNIADRMFKPSIAANGDLFFMADTSQGNPPQWRLYVSRHTAQGYAKAEPLSFSDGKYPDVDPFIAPDQSYIIFSCRDRPPFKDGREHLFIAFRGVTGWSDPVAIRYAGDMIGADDGEAQVGPDGATLYFTSGRVLPVKPGRSRAQLQADVDRMAAWDNSNANVWTLPIGALLARHHLS